MLKIPTTIAVQSLLSIEGVARGYREKPLSYTDFPLFDPPIKQMKGRRGMLFLWADADEQG